MNTVMEGKMKRAKHIHTHRTEHPTIWKVYLTINQERKCFMVSETISRVLKKYLRILWQNETIQSLNLF